MKLRRRLANPFLLVGQGFLGGAIVFFALAHSSGEAHSPATAVQATTIQATAHAVNR